MKSWELPSVLINDLAHRLRNNLKIRFEDKARIINIFNLCTYYIYFILLNRVYDLDELTTKDNNYIGSDCLVKECLEFVRSRLDG